jgi:hypothetical protein
MKNFLKNLESIKRKSDTLFFDLKNKFSVSQNSEKNNLNYTKAPEFQKVECFDVNKKTHSKDGSSSSYSFHSSNYQFIKLEKEDPKLITLTEKQKIVLGNYINKSLFDYHRGTIFIDDHSLKNFKNIQHAIETDSNISKECVNFVLTDMYKSYTREGHHNMLDQVHEEDEVYEYIKKKE